jgi:hypothetical protein
MLKGLFSNQNVARILLFLFVNERCYGTQIQSVLRVPLTPIQKALLRLEKEGVLSSHYEGKTRIYQFSSAYPLRFELELLLKKAYTLLSAQEKKLYCYIHKPRVSLKEEWERDRHRRKELLAFWDRLSAIGHLSFSTKTRQGVEQIVKIGKADVSVTATAGSVITFQEKGHWYVGHEPDTAFSNSFRWMLDLSSLLISLEHLRYGNTRPVFLFNLTPTRSNVLETVDAHLCAEDTYLGHISWSEKSIDFHWRIIGPHKNNQLMYHYY